MAGVVNVRHLGEVAVVEMNRPERRNAMNTRLLENLVDRLRDLRGHDGTQAVVITGAGGAFSAGADVSERVDAAGAEQRMQLFTMLYAMVSGFPKPTVAAITGPCIGGGAEVAAACDLRVGTPAASVRFPGAAFGIPVGAARLPLIVGLSHAKDLLLTARTFGAEEAYRMGFLNRLVENGEVEHEAVALAAASAANPGSPQTKRLLDEAAGLSRRVLAENRELVRWQRERPD